MNMSGVCKIGVEPSGGDTYSVTCFVCGMPSSKDWAERVRTRPPSSHQHHQVPFYPCLLDMVPAPPGAILMEDGSTWLCAFCHALLEAQWNNYENKSERIPPMERTYNVHKFICAVCAVETYRKRVRALPFQEFPFLVKHRQPNSITLVNNPVAIVCLDCSETLWAQSNEYDRWGLPIHKRHFNWMARPPPPEDSVEATVARLPSGETQLPRCPPTDPLVPPKTNEPMAMPEAIAPVRSNKPKSSGGSTRYDLSTQSHPLAHSGSSRHHHQQQQQQQHVQEQSISMHQPHSAVASGSGRKTSVGPTSSPTLDLAGPHSQPPVVTVAPMSTQHTLTNTRKDSMSVTVTQVRSPSPSTHRSSPGSNTSHHASTLFHQTPLFSPSGSYPGPFSWPASLSSRNTELPPGHSNSSFSNYGGNPMQPSESLPNPPTWPWLQPTSPELLRYQSYISSLQSRGLADPYFATGAGIYHPSSTISSIATYLPSLHTQQSSIGSPSPPAHFAHTSSAAGTAAQQQQHNLMLQQHGARLQGTSRERESPPTQVPGNSGTRYATSPHSQYHKLTKTYTIQSEEEPVSHPRQSTDNKSSSKSSVQSSDDSSYREKCAKIDFEVQDPQDVEQFHSKSRKNTSKRTSPTLKSDSSSRDSVGSTSKRIDMIHPKKRHWQPQPSVSENQDLSPSSSHDKDEQFQLADKKRKFSLSLLPQGEQEGEPMDFTVKRKSSVPNETPSSVPHSPKSCQKEGNESSRETAMDLSLPSTSSSGSFRSRTTSCPTSSKFSIAYLCKSESVPPACVPSTSEEPSSSSNRSSVIVTTPITKDKLVKDSPKSEDSESKSADEVSAPLDEDKTNENKPKEAETKENKSSKPEDSTDTSETQTSDLTITQQNSPKDENVEMESQLETEVVDTREEPIENKNSDTKEEGQKDTTPMVETQINMVTVGDIRIAPEDFIRKTIEIFVNEEKEVEIKRKKQLHKQLDFLSCLGLITPEKKMELELETLAYRSSKNTIPPLKLRIESPPLETIDEEIKQQLVQVAFDDPSLKENSNDPKKSYFLKHLGLKPCSKYDKSRREVIWRQILTERFMRERRNDKLCGVKRPWDTYTKVSKLLTLPKRVARSCRPNSFSECLTSLSLTLPKELEEINGPRRNSSDLLTTVESTQSITVTTTASGTTNLNEINPAIFKNGTCINYPKYIPSYVLPAQLKEEEEGKTEEITVQPKLTEILNVPSVTPMTSFPQSPPAVTVGIETILRIPVINSSSTSLMTASRRSSNSTLQTTTSEDSDGDLSSTEIEIKHLRTELDTEKSKYSDTNQNIGRQSTKNGSSSCQWSEVEGILKASTAQWEKTKKVMEEALRQTDYLQSKENQKLLEDGAAHFRAIRRHLKTQQSDMKQTEKLFKGKEKEVIKKLRTLTKYSNSKDST